jgi:hypothetical protein
VCVLCVCVLCVCERERRCTACPAHRRTHDPQRLPRRPRPAAPAPPPGRRPRPVAVAPLPPPSFRRRRPAATVGCDAVSFNTAAAGRSRDVTSGAGGGIVRRTAPRPGILLCGGGMASHVVAGARRGAPHAPHGCALASERGPTLALVSAVASERGPTVSTRGY